jgi:hypothetical protein
VEIFLSFPGNDIDFEGTFRHEILKNEKGLVDLGDIANKKC